MKMVVQSNPISTPTRLLPAQDFASDCQKSSTARGLTRGFCEVDDPCRAQMEESIPQSASRPVSIGADGLHRPCKSRDTLHKVPHHLEIRTWYSNLRVGHDLIFCFPESGH